MSVENGRLLRDMNLNDEAIQVFKKVITDNPRDKLAFNELAFTYSLMKKHEEAITYVNATLHLDKDNVYARYLKGNSLISLDRTHQGIEELKKAISIKPGPVYYNQLGLAYGQVNEYDKAIECYEEAYKLVPKNIYKNNIADVYIKTKKYDKAMDILIKVLENDENYTIALSNLSECYIEIQNYEEALKYINKAIEKDPGNIVYYFIRGKLYQDHLKNKKAALNDFDQAYEISLNGISTGNIFSTNASYKSMLEQVKLERIKLSKILSDVNQLESELDTLVEKMEDKDNKSNIFESLKNLKKEKEKASENIGLADKIDILEMVKAESEKIMKRILETESQMKNHYEIMKKAGVVDQAYVNSQFSNLKEYKELYDYAKVFYWTLVNYFGAYRSLSTNLQQANHDHDAVMDNHQKMLEGISKVSSVAHSICEGVPIVGSVISIIDNIVGMISRASKEMKFQNRVNSINKIIMFNQDENTLEQGLSISVGKASVDLAFKMENRIKNCQFENEDTGNFDSIYNFFDKSINNLKVALSGENKVNMYDSPSCTLALKDVTLVLCYMYENYDKIINSQESLDKQILIIVESGLAEKMLKNTKLKQNEEAACKCSVCIIF
jgi:tetratricopeptide (TPR) repeat protein